MASYNPVSVSDLSRRPNSGGLQNVLGRFNNTGDLQFGRLALGQPPTVLKNILDVQGSVAVGSFAFVATGPTGGMIVSGQVGIGTSGPTGSSILDVSSTTQAVTIPRLTTTQMNAVVAPANGSLIYNITDKAVKQFDSATGAWFSGFIAQSATFSHILTAVNNVVTAGAAGVNGWSFQTVGNVTGTMSTAPVTGSTDYTLNSISPATGSFIQWDAGTGYQNGVYTLAWATRLWLSTGILSVTENTTGQLLRGPFDTYFADSTTVGQGSKALFRDSFLWNQGTGAHMFLRWTINGKNASSSALTLSLLNTVEVVRTG